MTPSAARGVLDAILYRRRCAGTSAASPPSIRGGCRPTQTPALPTRRHPPQRDPGQDLARATVESWMRDPASVRALPRRFRGARGGAGRESHTAEQPRLATRRLPHRRVAAADPEGQQAAHQAGRRRGPRTGHRRRSTSACSSGGSRRGSASTAPTSAAGSSPATSRARTAAERPLTTGTNRSDLMLYDIRFGDDHATGVNRRASSRPWSARGSCTATRQAPGPNGEPPVTMLRLGDKGGGHP